MMDLVQFVEGRASWSMNLYFCMEAGSGWEYWDKRLPLPPFWERSRATTDEAWQELLGLAETLRPFDADFLELLWHQQEIFVVYMQERRRGIIVRLLADTSDLPANPRKSLGILLDYVKAAFERETIVPTPFFAVVQDYAQVPSSALTKLFKASIIVTHRKLRPLLEKWPDLIGIRVLKRLGSSHAAASRKVDDMSLAILLKRGTTLQEAQKLMQQVKTNFQKDVVAPMDVNVSFEIAIADDQPLIGTAVSLAKGQFGTLARA